LKLAYVDTSCLVAVAFGEPGVKRMQSRLGGFGRLLSSNLLEAELRATLVREKVDADPDELLSWIGWFHPDRPLSREYRRVLEHGFVRGADLWHLACALFLAERLGKITFLTLDKRQRESARALGLAV
jgi:predicted nucleic acid-binding protein